MKDIKTILKFAEQDMHHNGRLSKSTYVDIVEAAKEGIAFSVTVSLHDSLKMRRVMTYYHMSGVMHQHLTGNGTIEVSFNK